MDISGKMTRAEVAISKLKLAVSDLAEGDELFEDDLYLLRWLKAQNLDVKKAEKMIRESLIWRKENKCDQWLYDDFHPGISDMIKIHKGRCKNGAPICCVDAGTADLRKFIDKFGKEETFKYVMQHMVVDEVTSINWNREVFDRKNCGRITEESTQGNLLVIDVKKASYRLISSVKAMQLIKQVAVDYVNFFPDLGSVLILVNCHRIILPLINLLKPLVESPYLAVECYDSNEERWKEALLQRADPDQLPVAFGGSVKNNDL